MAAAVTQITYWLLTPRSGGLLGLASLALPGVLIALAVAMLRLVHRVPPLLWALFPQLGLVTIAYLDITSRDVSAAGQVFFCLPVLYAAAQLPTPTAWATALLGVVAEAVTTLSVEPVGRAVIDTCYVAVALGAMTLALTRSTSRQVALMEQLQVQAGRDPLTGLATRRVLDDALRQLGPAPGRAGTALALLDLDYFKQINDRFGHPVGDLALCHTAALVTARHPPAAAEIACRLGGDEIAVLMPDCTYAEAVRRATGIVSAVSSHPLSLADGIQLPLSVSVGLGHLDGGTQPDPLALYRLADVSLYQAKQAGRGRVGLIPDPAAGPEPQSKGVAGC